MSTPPPPGSYPSAPYGAPAPQGGGAPYGPPGVPSWDGAPHPGPSPYGNPATHRWAGPQFPAGPACQVCGARPAAHAVIRGHQGFLVIMRFLKREGDFCRDCGTSFYRSMTAATLWQGWWGPLSAVITPFTVLLNLGPRAVMRRLPAPAGAVRRPLDPGKRVLARPPALIPLAAVGLALALVTVLIGVGLVAGGGTAAAGVSVGDCVRNNAAWPEQDIERVGCSGGDSQYRVAPDADCSPGAYLLSPEYSRDGSALCLEPVR
ncbi:LppU/SCO3897 family protein [Streptomyces sp. NPDC054887]